MELPTLLSVTIVVHTQNASNVNLTKLHADRANDWYTQGD